MPAKVILLGSGALVRAVCYSLATGDLPITVTVVARNEAKANEVAYVGNARAALSGAPVRCGAAQAELADSPDLSKVLRAMAPDIVVLAASYQSPWEPMTAPSAWTGLLERELPNVTSALAAQRTADRRELNMVTGHGAALLISDLLRGTEIHTNLPGPLGLPGGYPVRVGPGGVELDLPDGITPDAAVEWNRAAGRREGADLEDGEVRFSHRILEALEPHMPELAEGFPVAEAAKVAERLLTLRKSLRSRPY